MEIKGFENYLIYDDGLIFSQKNNIFRKERITKKGYSIIDLHKKKRKTFSIHRLVALHYLPNPEMKLEVDHIDGNKQNNHISNLRWVTAVENKNNFQPHYKNNQSGFKNICYHKHNKSYQFKKTIYKKRYEKNFESKIDCICYKFIFILRMRAGHFKLK
mgnify:CR=1 FL=1